MVTFVPFSLHLCLERLENCFWKLDCESVVIQKQIATVNEAAHSLSLSPLLYTCFAVCLIRADNELLQACIFASDNYDINIFVHYKECFLTL